MSKRLLWALLLIAVLVLALIFNTGSRVNVSVGFHDFHVVSAIAFFCFSAVGVVIGILLR